MIRPSRWLCGRLGMSLLIGSLLLSLAGLAPVRDINTATASPSARQLSAFGGRGVAWAATAQDCPAPSNGDLFQAADDGLYLYTNGVLRAIPDRETLRALGLDPNGADPIRDECLRTLRPGDPFPSASPGGQPGRTTAAAAPTAPRDPSIPNVALEASDPRPGRQTTVHLTARTDAPEGSGMLLSIHRQADTGHAGASGLVTTCADTSVCTVEVWEDQALTWIFVATLYQCAAPGSCVAVQESSPVVVTWQ